MAVLRENRDSLIAVLEAFVHDPLLSWRLLNTDETTHRSQTTPPPTAIAPHTSINTISAQASVSETMMPTPTNSKQHSHPHPETETEGILCFVNQALSFETGFSSSNNAAALLTLNEKDPDSTVRTQFQPAHSTIIPGPPSTLFDSPAKTTSKTHLNASSFRLDSNVRKGDVSSDYLTAMSFSFQHPSLRSISLAERMVYSKARTNVVPLSASSVAEDEEEEGSGLQEELQEKAVAVIRRVKDKLTGLDFPSLRGRGPNRPLDVPEQVDRLIQQATSRDLLCEGFFGWCPFW